MSLAFLSRIVSKFGIARELYVYFVQKEIARRMLLRNGIGLLVVHSDCSKGMNPPIIEAAMGLKIAVLVLTYTNLPFSPEQKLRLRATKLGDFECRSSVVKLLFRLYNKNIVYMSKHDGKMYYPYDLDVILVKILTKTLSPNPWVVGCGPCTAVACASEAQRDAFIELGVEHSRLHVVGSAEFDMLYQTMSRLDKGKTERLPGRNPMTLFSVPPITEHKLASPEDAKILTDIMRYLVHEIKGMDTVLSVHPRIDRARFCQTHGIDSSIISSAPITEDIVRCDLFIGHIASATVMLAAAAGKPVIVLDFFRSEINWFDHERSVWVARDFSQFRVAVEEVVQGLRDEIPDGRDQTYLSTRFGAVDGRGTGGIRQLCVALANDHVNS